MRTSAQNHGLTLEAVVMKQQLEISGTIKLTHNQKNPTQHKGKYSYFKHKALLPYYSLKFFHICPHLSVPLVQSTGAIPFK